MEKSTAYPTYKDSSLSEYFVWDQDIADKYNIDVNSVTDFNTLYDALKTVKEGEADLRTSCPKMVQTSC